MKVIKRDIKTMTDAEAEAIRDMLSQTEGWGQMATLFPRLKKAVDALPETGWLINVAPEMRRVVEAAWERMLERSPR